MSARHLIPLAMLTLLSAVGCSPAPEAPSTHASEEKAAVSNPPEPEPILPQFTKLQWHLTDRERVLDNGGLKTDWSGSKLVFTTQTETAQGLDLVGYVEWRSVKDGGSVACRTDFSGTYEKKTRTITLRGVRDSVSPNGKSKFYLKANLRGILSGSWQPWDAAKSREFEGAGA